MKVIIFISVTLVLLMVGTVMHVLNAPKRRQRIEGLRLKGIVIEPDAWPTSSKVVLVDFGLGDEAWLVDDLAKSDCDWRNKMVIGARLLYPNPGRSALERRYGEVVRRTVRYSA